MVNEAVLHAVSVEHLTVLLLNYVTTMCFFSIGRKQAITCRVCGHIYSMWTYLSLTRKLCHGEVILDTDSNDLYIHLIINAGEVEKNVFLYLIFLHFYLYNEI